LEYKQRYRDKHEFDVQRRISLQPSRGKLGYEQGYRHEWHVPKRISIQSSCGNLEYEQGYRHEFHVLWRDSVQPEFVRVA
jgi:hypothetical protein